MKKFLARAIVAFAGLVTWPLSPARRGETRLLARELLLAIVPVETDRGRLIFDASSRWGFRWARNFLGGEPETREWLDALPDDACVWDIGANIGIVSLYAALVPGRRVLAFEPAAASFAALNRNIALNRMADRVAAYCIAFSEETRLDTLNMARTSAGTSMHGFGTETDQFGRTIDTRFRQGAVGFSIDDFVATFAPPLPTHVKIDVDGIEAEILRGGRKTLSAPSVRSMIVEIEKDLESPRNREILALVTGLGFVARPKASPELRNVVFDRPPPGGGGSGRDVRAANRL